MNWIGFVQSCSDTSRSGASGGGGRLQNQPENMELVEWLPGCVQSSLAVEAITLTNSASANGPLAVTCALEAAAGGGDPLLAVMLA